MSPSTGEAPRAMERAHLAKFSLPLLAALAAAALLVSATPARAQPADPALTAAVDGAWREPANRARDVWRHPAESLSFWGLKPGMTVVEVDPGVRGWWTEILAPYARATGGTYIAALPDRAQAAGGPESPEAAHAAFWNGVSDKAVFGEVKAYDFGPQHPDSIPAGSADLVLVARAFHNWARQGDATEVYMRAFFTLLKPGGILAVEQHRAPDGADPRAGTGYVPESYVIDAAQQGRLHARSEVGNQRQSARHARLSVRRLDPAADPPQRPAGPAPKPDLRPRQI